jgi:hypothetical protein
VAGATGTHVRELKRLPAPGRLAAPFRPNFLSVSRLVRLHEPRHSGKFGNPGTFDEVDAAEVGRADSPGQKDSTASTVIPA